MAWRPGKSVARDVPLQEGKNTIVVRVGNEDGWGLQPATAEVVLAKPPPPRPTITVLDPLRNATVSAVAHTRSTFPFARRAP